MSRVTPFVSVILCNYNYGRYIGQAIESVLRQTFPDFELIIVDDGSTDDSQQVIASYNDPRIRTFFQPNGGQAAAFNTGFAQSEGQLVAFLDSDDTWKPEKLAKVIEAFQAKENLTVVQHNLEIIGSNAQRTRKMHPGIKPGVTNVEFYFTYHHTNIFSTTSGIVCNRTALERIFPLDEDWRICADVALTRPLPAFGDVLTLKSVLGYYRVHGGNNWTNTLPQSQKIENNIRYAEYANQWLAKLGYSKRIDFTESKLYQLQILPEYHPRRMWHRLVSIAVSAIRGLPGKTALGKKTY